MPGHGRVDDGGRDFGLGVAVGNAGIATFAASDNASPSLLHASANEATASNEPSTRDRRLGFVLPTTSKKEAF